MAAGCAALPLIFSNASAMPERRAGDWVDRRLVRIFSSTKSPAVLAKRLRRSCGSAPAVDRQFPTELARLRAWAAAPIDDAELGAKIGRCVTADFASRRIVMLDGWLLSHTEVALCHAVSGRDGEAPTSP